MVIIDPFPAYSRTLHKMIRDRIPHANVLEANNFDQAHEVMKNNSPDIVFLDIATFPKNCTKYIRTLKRQLPESIIVVLTIHDSAEHEAAALTHGADYFFSKTNASIWSLIHTVEKTFS